VIDKLPMPHHWLASVASRLFAVVPVPTVLTIAVSLVSQTALIRPHTAWRDSESARSAKPTGSLGDRATKRLAG